MVTRPNLRLRLLLGNVFGLMPHPERCSEAILGGVDGLQLFESLMRAGASKALAHR